MGFNDKKCEKKTKNVQINYQIGHHFMSRLKLMYLKKK